MKHETMRHYTIGALFAVGCVLALGGGSAWAESACKGMAQSGCEEAADCLWVGGYEKKDGKKVAGYCRTKSKGGASDEKADKPATTSKDKK